VIVKKTGEKDLITGFEVIFFLGFWVINVKERISHIQKSRISIVMFDKDEKDDNVKGFFDREEKEQNFADIIKIFIDLSGNPTWSDLKLSKFHCIVGNN
jgi:hypothetical protein